MAKGTVDFKEITFCIQGPFFRRSDGATTDDLVRSIRSNFPGSPIVFSTWEGEDVGSVDVDKFVFSPDPGGSRFSRFDARLTNNTNRQIVSSYEGLKAVDTSFAVRLRSDLFVTSARIARLLYALPTRNRDSSTWFFSPLIFLDRFTVDPRRWNLPMHPCDWVTAGRTEDNLRFWNRSLVEKSDAIFFLNSDEESFYLPRFQPEAHLWVDLRREATGQSMDHGRVNEAEIRFPNTVESFVRNIIPLSQYRTGIASLKHDGGYFCSRSSWIYEITTWSEDARKQGVEIVKLRKNIEDWLWLLTKSSDRLRSLCSQMFAAIARWGIDGKIAKYRRNAARVMR